VRRLVTAINRDMALRNRIDSIILSLNNAQERRGGHAYDQDIKTSRVMQVVRKAPLKRGQSDLAYWQTQPYEARLAALEEIRREYHRWKYGAEPKFQRVYRIVNLKRNKKASGRHQDLADVENLTN